MRRMSEKDKCVFCGEKANDKTYCFANRFFQLCDRCKLLVNLLTYGLDKDCVHEGEPVEDEDFEMPDLGYIDYIDELAESAEEAEKERQYYNAEFGDGKDATVKDGVMQDDIDWYPISSEFPPDLRAEDLTDRYPYMDTDDLNRDFEKCQQAKAGSSTSVKKSRHGKKKNKHTEFLPFP